ncbi:MAG: 50S ribosomal protein L30 [Bacteroidota bacterium]|nr:50S ribosomal protein L30 [Bacteroidota bacterium]
MAQVKITQVKSTIDRPERQKRTILALGLGKLHRTVVMEETPQIAGMIRKVQHLITVEKV